MSLEQPPLPVLINVWMKAYSFVENPTGQTKKEYEEAKETLLRFEKGEGDPETLTKIDNELSETLPSYKQRMFEYNRRNPEKE